MIHKTILNSHNYLLLFLLSSVIILNSCEKNIDELSIQKEFSGGDITVENGYLSFPSQNLLEDYISDLDKQITQNSTYGAELKSTSNIDIPQGF